MRKLLLLIVSIAIAACIAWFGWQQRGEEAPRDRAVSGATDDPGRDPGAPAHGGVHAGPVVGSSHRVEGGAAPPPAPDPVATAVIVTVVDAGDRTAVPDRDVTILDTSLADPFFGRGRTDAQGKVRLHVPVTATRQLVAYTAGGEEAWFDLEPGQRRELLLQLSASLYVEGVVVDGGGHGVADADVLFLPWLVRHVPELPRVSRVGRTRSDGRFRVALPGNGHIGAVHPRHAPTAMTLVEAEAPATRPTLVRVRLTLGSPPGHASGIVVDADGRPVAAALIEFRTLTAPGRSTDLPAPPIRLRSDRDGRFATAELRPGKVRYEARAQDDGGDCARGVFVAAETAGAELRIELQAPASIHGTIRPTADERLPPIVVQVGRRGDLLADQTDCADDGSFRLTGQPAGTAELLAREIRPLSSPLVRRRATAHLELAAGEDRTWSPRFDSLRGPRLEGLVTDARNAPLAGWTILSRQGGADPQRVATDVAGRFLVPASGPASFRVFVYAPGQPPTTFAAAVAHDVAPDAGLVVLQVDLTATAGEIRGRVESSERQQLPAKVACWHRGRNQTMHTTAADDGTFRFAGVPAGDVVLFCSHPGFLQQSHDTAIGAGIDVDVGVITMAYGSLVRGSVTATAGAVPDDLAVSIQTEGQRFTATYAAGSYRFDAVPPGEHRLLVQGSGIAAASHPIQVEPGTGLGQDIVIVPGLARTIRVIADASTGDWVSLALQQQGQPYTWLTSSPRQGDRIDFVAYMAAGTYQAVAWDDAGRRGRTTVTFAAGASAPTVITLAR